MISLMLPLTLHEHIHIISEMLKEKSDILGKDVFVGTAMKLCGWIEEISVT